MAVLAPHLVRLERVAPGYAIAVWSSALAIRALVSVLGAFFVVVVVPHSQLLDAFSHWCWDTLLPLLGIQLELSGHRLGDAATLIPTIVIGTSLLVVVHGTMRAARRIARLVAHHSLGTGPRGSVIVGGTDVVLGSAGLAHPRILVSAGALLRLEDDELAAGLAHEQGHIARRHRFFLLFAELCRGLGRFVPGTNAACRALVFHLERDADRWAIAHDHEPLVLARAICKAQNAFSGGPAYARLDGGCAPQRVAELVRPPVAPSSNALIRGLATVMVLSTLSLLAWAPATAAAGMATFAKEHPVHHCEH